MTTLSELKTWATDEIAKRDHDIAQTSETILLGYALDNINKAQTNRSVMEQLAWWKRAYKAYSIRDDASVVDLLLEGDLEGAEAAANGENES